MWEKLFFYYFNNCCVSFFYIYFCKNTKTPKLKKYPPAPGAPSPRASRSAPRLPSRGRLCNLCGRCLGGLGAGHRRRRLVVGLLGWRPRACWPCSGSRVGGSAPVGCALASRLLAGPGARPMPDAVGGLGPVAPSARDVDANGRRDKDNQKSRLASAPAPARGLKLV
jgi:hypothetical protein